MAGQHSRAAKRNRAINRPNDKYNHLLDAYTGAVSVELLPTKILWCQPVSLVPMIRPRLKVMPAAISPKMICRKPEYNTLRPVSSVIPAPIPNSASADKTALTNTPSVPEMKKNGDTGIIAPVRTDKRRQRLRPQPT